jgi:hypothetical protein
MYVRYACGESKPWRQVDAATLTRLRALSSDTLRPRPRRPMSGLPPGPPRA